MSHLLHVAIREMRIGFRNPWAYTFMGLFSLFMLALLLIQAKGYVQGYSGLTGTMLNLVLYLLPLMTLMLGSFSMTGEKEDGSWELLSTYPLRTASFIAGKFIGLAVVLVCITAAGFGLAGIAGWAAGTGFSFDAYRLLIIFSVSLSFMFLAVALLVGTIAKNRWQALTIAVAIWFFMIIAWAPLLIAVLGMLPYMWIKPGITLLTLFNPAELARLFAVVKLGGGAMLGAEYYDWVKWIRQPAGFYGFVTMCMLWIAIATGAAGMLWERGRTRD